MLQLAQFSAQMSALILPRVNPALIRKYIFKRVNPASHFFLFENQIDFRIPFYFSRIYTGQISADIWAENCANSNVLL
jgi:hypothetical protein